MSKKPNWLLRGLILVSIAVHALVFMHISGIYKSRTWTYVELTLRSYAKPQVPDIPEPQQVPKPASPAVETGKANLKEGPPHPPVKTRKPTLKRRPTPPAIETGKVDLKAQSIPSVEPSRAQPQETSYPDSIAESILPAAPPVAAGPEIARGEADSTATSQGTPEESQVPSGPGDADTADAYFAMIRSRIESHKSYPESARMRNAEGRVVVGFLLQLDGTVSSIELTRKSAHDALNQAALDAVRKASPFPKPPARLFKKEIPLQIAVAFEIR